MYRPRYRPILLCTSITPSKFEPVVALYLDESPNTTSPAELHYRCGAWLDLNEV